MANTRTPDGSPGLPGRGRTRTPARGKFRSFLLTALEHFLVNEWRRDRTVKRGGDYRFVSWDALEAERRYSAEPVSTLTPEKVFEKRWAVTLLGGVLANLREECRLNGKTHLFEALKDSLWGDRTALSYSELARCWEMSEGAACEPPEPSTVDDTDTAPSPLLPF